MQMKHQRHFDASETVLREVAQIRKVIVDLDRTVQFLDCDVATEEERGRVSYRSDPRIRSSPGRWQHAGTIFGTPLLRLNSALRRSKYPWLRRSRPSAPMNSCPNRDRQRLGQLRGQP